MLYYCLISYYSPKQDVFAAGGWCRITVIGLYLSLKSRVKLLMPEYMADFANFYKELVDQHGREASCDLLR